MSQIKLGLIGGTGLADLLRESGQSTSHDIQTSFGKPSDVIFETTWDGLAVLLLGRHGPGHLLNPSQVPFRANIFALKQLGCTHIFASGAVGSLRQELKPGDLVIADQIIDKTYERAGTFFEKAAVHVEFSEPFCPVLRRILIEQGAGGARAVHDRGTYVCMEGPAFSTRSESLMHRLWGGDLIGMTAMPEAKLAREAEIPYALVALVTDYDSWKPKAEGTQTESLLKEILSNVQSASKRAMELIRKTVKKIAADPAPLMECPARRALELAIWSDRSRLDREEVRRLSILWGKYLG
jgi:5'-methylthioadenosine phosphorylase